MGSRSGTGADALVVSWNADHSWNTLKDGTNGWVCYDRSGEGNRPDFAVQCTHVANLERIAQNRRFAAEGGDRAGVRALVEAAAADGTRVPAEFGSVWFATNGPDLASARTHVTVSVPGATSESLGLPSGRSPGMITIMQGGTTEAHLMVPSR